MNRGLKIFLSFCFTGIAALLSKSAAAQVLEPPVFNCIQVQDDGSALLNWTPIADPDGLFTHYEVFTSLFPGIPFTSVGSVAPVSESSYLHVTTNTLSNDYYYYIQTWSTDGVSNYASVTSDTLRNIFLEAVPAGNNCQNCDSSAYLNWNSPYLNEFNVPSGLVYEVWTDYPDDTWHLLQTLPYGVTNWLYIVENCQPDTMNFQIRMTDPSGCQFISNIDGDNFSDNTHPQTAPITGISTSLNNDAVLTWQASASDDTEGYYIYECNGNNTSLIDFVVGWNNTTFTDVFSNPDAGPMSYAIAAVDFCGTADTTICATSVFLDTENFTPCDEGILMDWTAFQGWDDPVDFYVVHATFSLDPDFTDDVFVPIDTIPGSQNSLTFIDFDFQEGGNNVYQIEAVSSATGFQAWSNYSAVFVPSYDPPAYVYLASTSVISEDSVRIVIEIDPTLLPFDYKLERFDESGNDWDEVIVFEAANEDSLTFIDQGLSCDVFSYEYRVQVINACGLAVDTTNLGRTMLLEGAATQNRLVNTLVWTTYGDWNNGVSTYNIYRKNGVDSVYQWIAQISPDAGIFYEDDVSLLQQASGEFCYRIEAVEGASSPAGNINSSWSNEICLVMEPVIWVPNAFVIDGFNRTFSPVISFADFESYRMLVYSRWGDVIFETTDINVPWDGNMKGKLVQEGTYTYFITIKDGNGRAYERAGYVTLLSAREK